MSLLDDKLETFVAVCETTIVYHKTFMHTEMIERIAKVYGEVISAQ